MYGLKIGTRTALTFFIVVLVTLAFSISSILLLQYGKNIDIKIANSFSPVINTIKDFEFIIKESGRLTKDLTLQYDENKVLRLQKILDRIYTKQKITVIGLCQEPGLDGVRTRLVQVDDKFQELAIKERKVISLLNTPEAFSDTNKLSEAQKVNIEVETEIERLLLMTNESGLEAIQAFNNLDAQKFASYRTLSYLLVLMIVVIIAFGALSIFITNFTIIQPIMELSSILDEVAAGRVVKFESEIPRHDEVGTIINSAQQLVNSFRDKAEVARAIGEGNYDIEIPLLSPQDKLGMALVEMRNNLKESTIKEKEYTNNLEEYALNLRKKNKELDQFAYIISHDLKGSMRGISNLAEWIYEDMEENITEDSKKYFHMLRGRVSRLETLINSILKFSKIGKIKMDHATINTRQLVINVLRKLRIPEKYSIYFDDALPEVFGNIAELEDVFTDLIHNALKYNNNTKPVVNISFIENENDFIFCIADNGPGIAKEFHEKIFTIFQTLESRDKIESAGAGLAIVKKILEENSCNIWLDSELGNGARFYFTWNKVKQNKMLVDNARPKLLV